ncbi:hypothetical protein L3Q82_007701 [Scortum barcoo]|uniref:Uncharacterized protein n=1 Tax=Scortum barcoo TaxID=214431 RepID=A0ACB8WQC1_9TELE|nr:hypothetical protein L3Q82_007701 [Scortum barcoo]
MGHPATQLPPEVWNHVFGFLSVTDRFNVRATCRVFKKLVDHRCLWKDWSVVLDFQNGPYNSPFWATLNRRRVTSVVMRSTRAKDWRMLAAGLPLTTVLVMDPSSQASLNHLQDFAHLKRLGIRGSSLLPDAFTVRRPHQLTHLSICDVPVSVTAMGRFISSLSQFSNLTSLVFHPMGILKEPVWMVRSILTCLPKLKHLSLSDLSLWALNSIPRPNPGPLGGAQRPPSALSSLELTNCLNDSLPEDAMRLMPGLRSLAVFHRHSHHDMSDRWLSPVCHLKTWLTDLSQLSTLVIVKGAPVKEYVMSIPATVTSLTLCVEGITSGDIGSCGGAGTRSPAPSHRPLAHTSGS